MTQFVKFLYSGGASNSDPAASLGGLVSSVEVGMGSLSWEGSDVMSTSGAFTLVGSYGGNDSVLDDCFLVFRLSGNRVYFTSSFEEVDQGTPISETGRYHFHDLNGGAQGTVVVDVDVSLLPAQNESQAIDVVDSYTANLFDAVTPDESVYGVTKYRCIYIESQESVSKTLNVWLSEYSAKGDSIAIGLTSVTSGGIENEIANETTEPTGILEWKSPTDVTSALTATLNSGETIGLWIRQTVNQLNQLPTTVKDTEIEVLLT